MVSIVFLLLIGVAILKTSNKHTVDTNIENELEKIEKLNVSKGLDDCKFNNEFPECFKGYTCYYSKPGGLTPNGIVYGPISGDLKCHKSCSTDNDCPATTPVCIARELTLGDTGDVARMCFSEKYGAKVREEDYKRCLVSETEGIEYRMKNNSKILDQLIFNFATGNPLEILKNEYKLENVRESWGNYFTSLPKSDLVETICKMREDGRISSVYLVSSH